jgi:NAD(P)-dependent dehydrogenase (short-subunit alcohol dehydrogenase family)
MTPQAQGKGPLAGLRALVVGASSGIGRASAGLLLADGARVVLAGRTEARLREVAAELAREAPASDLAWIRCDAMESEDVRRAVETAGGDAGLDIAVIVPGGGNYSPVLGYDDDLFGSEVLANVRPQYLVLKYAGLSMVRSGGGSIVAISSTAAVMPSPFLAAYCAGKAAVDQLVRVAADELGRHGVRVNAVRPGLTRTGVTGPLFEAREVHARFLAQQPIARGGEPEDVARAVRFLAGPEASWVTGQCLTVDGGNTLRRFPDIEDLARGVVGDAVMDAVARGRLS